MADITVARQFRRNANTTRMTFSLISMVLWVASIDANQASAVWSIEMNGRGNVGSQLRQLGFDAVHCIDDVC